MKLAYRARSEIGPVRSLNEDCFVVNAGQSDCSTRRALRRLRRSRRSATR